MTLAEKILARAAGKEKVSAGEYVTAKIDKAMCQEAFAAVYMNLASAGIKKILNPDKVMVFLDHYVPAPTLKAASIHQLVRSGVEQYGIKYFYEGNHGVSHQVMMENGHVLPGELIVGTDSHTCTYGAFGAASCGIGFSDMAFVLATGQLWFRVPETIKFILSGELTSLITSKDVILKIAGDYSAEVAQYKAIEFVGSAAEKMSLSSRITIANMSIEIGAKFCFFEPDQKTLEYLKGRADGIKPAKSDGEANIVYEINISNIEPQVSLPHTVDNVKPISQVDNVPIQQAILGSCTNGRIEDLQLAAGLLRGKKVHPKVRLLVIPASRKIYMQAMEDGTLKTLLEAGGIILNPGCGPCFGSHMGLLAPGEKCISSTNRNFKGRMGSSEAEVYLASPATIAASAIRGHIADPRGL